MLRGVVARGGVLISSHNSTALQTPRMHSIENIKTGEGEGNFPLFYLVKTTFTGCGGIASFIQAPAAGNPGHRARSSWSGASPPEALMQGRGRLPSVGLAPRLPRATVQERLRALGAEVV
jgi:hypothetical protein